MADEREVFVILENDTNQGVPAKARVEGNAAAAQNGLIGFSFKDSSGNVVLPALNDEGAIVVSQDAGTPFQSRAEDATGSTSLIDLSGSEITVTLGEKYDCIRLNGSCTRDTLFQVVHTDDVGVGDTETVIGDFIVGAGQFSYPLDLGKYEYDTTGGTGTQDFKVKYQNLNKASTVRAALSLNEKPS